MVVGPLDRTRRRQRRGFDLGHGHGLPLGVQIELSDGKSITADAGTPLAYVPFGTDPYSTHQLLLKACRGAREVLDVGCSAGDLARHLAAQGAVVDGIELDPAAAGVARRHCRRVVVADVEVAGEEMADVEVAGGSVFTSSYDRVVFADILEHLRDPVSVLRRLGGLAGPEGKVVISLPNVANWWIRLQHLAGRWDYAERGIMDRTHLRFFTRRTALQMVREAGFEPESVTAVVPLPVLRRPPFNRLAFGLGQRFPNLLAYQFVIVARRGR